MGPEDGEGGWKPFAFRAETVIPLPVIPRRGRGGRPADLVLRLLDEVVQGGVGFVQPRAFAALGDAVMRCESGDLEGSLRSANLIAERDPALRPLALVIARMCVRKELDRMRAALA
jgi:hypothetical protein